MTKEQILIRKNAVLQRILALLALVEQSPKKNVAMLAYLSQHKEAAISATEEAKGLNKGFLAICRSVAYSIRAACDTGVDTEVAEHAGSELDAIDEEINAVEELEQ